MDFEKLAAEYMESFYIINHRKMQRKMHNSMRGEAFIIQFLAQTEKALSPSDISDFMGISTARTAAALGSLEGKNLLTRKIDPSDRRKVLVELTPLGEEQAREHENFVLKHTANLLSLLNEDEAREYVRLTSLLASRVTESEETSSSNSKENNY